MTDDLIVAGSGVLRRKGLSPWRRTSGFRFDVSDAQALHVVGPPPERSLHTLSRARWERKVVRRILFTDALVVAFAVGVAHVIRYYVIPVPQVFLDSMRPPIWSVSITVFVGWMIALSVSRTPDPKTFDNGSRQYQRVARCTFVLFAWVAITAMLLKWDLSRGFLALSFAFGTTLLFLERRAWRSWVLRKRLKGEYLARVLVIGGVRSAKAMTLRFSEDASSGFRVVGVWVPDRVAAPNERFHSNDSAVSVLGTESDLGQAPEVDVVDTVVVTDTEHLGHDGMRELAWALEGRDVNLPWRPTWSMSPDRASTSRPMATCPSSICPAPATLGHERSGGPCSTAASRQRY